MADPSYDDIELRRQKNREKSARHREKMKNDPDYKRRRSLYAKRDRERNSKRIEDYMDGYYARNREHLLAQMREYQEQNAEALRQYRTERAAIRRENSRRWRLRNPGAVQAQGLARRFRNAQPLWSDKKTIAAFYAARSDDMQVDHIVPLRGRTIEGYQVTGLHVSWNLQYLTPEENHRKKNKMRPEDSITSFPQQR